MDIQETRTKLNRLLIKDQDIRRKLKEGKVTIEDVENTDRENHKEFKEIIKEGIPFKSLDNDAYTAFITLLAHPSREDIDFMLQISEIIESTIDKDLIEPKDRALIVDRARVIRGENQIYGTQWDTKTGKLKPVEDVLNLNKRRAEVGLEPNNRPI